MAEVIYLYADRTPVQGQKAQATGPLGARVYVRETGAGIWIVHDEDDSKGGCFRHHQTACRFAEAEFGADAEIVVSRCSPRKRGSATSSSQSLSLIRCWLVTEPRLSHG